jgi:hypothetical protein
VRSSRPGAHGHAPLVDFCNRNDPQARLRAFETPLRIGPLGFRRTPPSGQVHVRRHGCPAQTGTSPRTGAEDSRVRGLFEERHCLSALLPRPLSPRLLAARASPRPDRLSDTSCRAPGCTAVGVTALRSERASEPSTLISSTRPRDPLARGSEEGRLPHPFAKRRCVPLHPRCLPSKDPPFREAAFSTACHQPVEWRPRAFSISAPLDTRTVRRWCGDSASASRWIDHPGVGRPPFPEE